jgi:type I restriction enzyme S subunit
MERNNVIKDIQNLPEGWKRVRLGEVLIENTKSPFKVEDADNNGRYPFFTSGETILYHSNYLVDKENIFLSTGGSAYVYYYNGKASYSADTYSIRSTIDTKYLYYYLLRKIKHITLRYFIGSGLEHLQKDDFKKKFEVLFPQKLPEQQKIAEILETVDNVIEKTDRIIEKYKRIKQGLMQDLLTKGIDESGNIRSEKTHKFKDSPLGRIPEEWEVVKLGEIFELKSGMTKPIDTSEFGNYPVYGGNGILGYTNEKNFNIETIIIGRVGEYCGSVYIANEGWVTDNALYVVAKKIGYNNIFLCYLLKYLNLNQFSAETGQPLMTQTIIYRIQIPLPPLLEQQRIAEILSQIDKTIEKEEQYKKKLERLKQGLMEDLLTGKVRVNHLIKEGVKNVLPT